MDIRKIVLDQLKGSLLDGKPGAEDVAVITVKTAIQEIEAQTELSNALLKTYEKKVTLLDDENQNEA